MKQIATKDIKIDARLVKTLRTQTGYPVHFCLKALKKYNGNLEEAKKYIESGDYK